MRGRGGALSARLAVLLGLLLVASSLAAPSSAAAANGTGTVIIEGSGSGEVISTPASGFEGNPPVACDYESPGPATGTCETELSSGSGLFGLILEAKPDPGSVLTGWVVEGAAITFSCGEEPICGGANEAEETHIVFKATFEPNPAPTITGLSPIEGPAAGGNTVIITGTTLTNVEAVEFDGTAANFASLVEVSPTEIEIEAPTHAAGTVDVFVTTEGGSSENTAADDYTYIAAPTITGLSPSKGPTAGGTIVTIAGTDLTNVGAVEFGGAAANPTSLEEISPTEIKVKTPVHNAGTASVVAITPGGPSADTPADDFTYVAQPAVTGLNPTSGPTSGGNEVEITGLRLSEATKVEFGTTAVEASNFIENTETTIKVNAPAHAAGTVNVKVTTIGGTSAAMFPNDDYTYIGPVTLTISNAGSGSGSVTCNGGPCASTYAFGSKVTVAATASGSTFAGWSGGGCSGTGVCVVTLDANTAVTATFNANPSPPPPPPCVVPKLKGMKLEKAKTALKNANCKTGKVTKPKPKKGKKQGPLVVKSSNPDAGTTLSADSKVNLKLKQKPKKS